MPDVKVTRENNGLFLFHLETEEAEEWVEEHVSEEVSFWGKALVVEGRYAQDLANGMLSDGLDVQ